MTKECDEALGFTPCVSLWLDAPLALKNQCTEVMPSAGHATFDLAALISECDANYLRIRRLLPNLESCHEWQLVLLVGDQEFGVACTVEARDRYTCLLRIAQPSFFPQSDFCQFGAPNLLVRIYLDTNSAEVVEMQRERAFRPWTKPQSRSGQAAFEKLHVNRFLGEYLNFCMRHGALAEKSISLE